MAFLELFNTIGSAFGSVAKPISIKDPSGNSVAPSGNLAGNLVTVSPSLQFLGARGLVPGASLKQISRFAVIPGTAKVLFTNSGNAYIEQTSGAQRSLKSTSASDSSAGSGIQKVYIEYIKGDGTEGAEEVILNGTTAVAMTETNLMHVNKFTASQVGSTGAAVGVVGLYTDNAGVGSVFASINTLDTREQTAHYYVPAGKTVYFDSFFFSTTDNGQIIVKISEEVYATKVIYHEVLNSNIDYHSGIILNDFVARIPQNGKLELYVKPTTTNKTYYALIRGWLVTN